MTRADECCDVCYEGHAVCVFEDVDGDEVFVCESEWCARQAMDWLGDGVHIVTSWS